MARVLKTLCVLFVLPFIFSACGEVKESVVTDFSADFTAEYAGMSLSGKISTDRRGLLNIEITSPDTLGGISIGYKNGTAELKREDLICTADEAYLPDGSFPSLLKEAFDALADAVVNKGAYPENGRIEAENNGRKFEFFTGEKGLIDRIETDGELEVVFSNIKITEQG